MRDRTADLLDANQALSQLSYSPVTLAVDIEWVWGQSKTAPLSYLPKLTAKFSLAPTVKTGSSPALQIHYFQCSICS
jgi:hypothetical protein